MNRVDVVIPVYAGLAITRRCIAAVLAHTSEALGLVFLVDDRGPEPGMAALLAEFRSADERVRVLQNEANLGFVGAANRGLFASQRDAVVLNSDTVVTPGWLDALRAALEDPSVAAACPLSNNAASCSVPRFGIGSSLEGFPHPVDTAQAPALTELPTGVGFCLLMRRSLIEVFGGFDPRYGRGYNEENDWCQRVRAAGFRIVRANHALVLHEGEVSFAGERAARDVLNGRVLIARYPGYLEENHAFEHSVPAHEAALQVRAAAGTLRVAVVQGELTDDAELDAAAAADSASIGREAIRVSIDEAPDLVHLFGTPSLEQLAGLLAHPWPLVHARFDPVAAEPRPGLQRWESVISRRAALTSLWRAASVIVPDAGTAARAEALFGSALPATITSPGTTPVTTPSAISADARWLITDPHFTSAELDAVCALEPRVTLDAAVGARPAFASIEVRQITDRPTAIAAARGLILPMRGLAGRPDALHAAAHGRPIVRLTGRRLEPVTSLWSPTLPWQTIHRQALVHAQRLATGRQRLIELLNHP